MKPGISLPLKLLALVLSVGGAHHADAADAVAGKQRASLCFACHGVDGVSEHETWPNLAGQNAQFLATQIKAFRDGGRKSPLMYPAVFDLSDQQIEDLAAYFSQLVCE